jgi:hypothetical protein
MSRSPSELTLAECEKRGWIAQVVEKFNTYTNRRKDLFGCIDIVALTNQGPLTETVGIQCTTRAHLHDRSAKILAEPRMRMWLEAGNRLYVWTWAKQGARGKRKLWRLREQEITLVDFQQWDAR